MSITSLQFLLLSVLTIALFQIALKFPNKQLTDFVLFAANIYFLSTFSSDGWSGFLPIFGFLSLGYFGVWFLMTKNSKSGFWIFLLVTFFLFFWLKKYAFIPKNIQLSGPYVTIGLSYMFFRMLQLLIDASSGNIASMPRIVTYVNYLLNFSTLISGPIQRYEAFLAAQDAPLRLNWIVFGNAVEKITFGVFKVMVAAALVNLWHLTALNDLSKVHLLFQATLSSSIVLVTYTIYLYLNFSGYTDIVIGVSRFIGNELPENFNRPFSALNFMDFWSRWHISLSTWLKTYVYNPLALRLMKVFPSSAADPYIGVFSFLVTFFLIGVWHGQTTVFVLFGLLQGGGVSGTKLYQILMTKRLGKKAYRELSGKWLYQISARGLTFTYFTLSLVCFWGDWPQIHLLAEKLGWEGTGLMILLIFTTSVVVLEILDRLHKAVFARNFLKGAGGKSRYFRTVLVTVLAVITVVFVSLAAAPAPDIIYKNF